MYFDKKYRPKTLGEVVGNPKIKKIIRSFDQDMPSLILLHGLPGCGKTTLARIIANKLDFEVINFNVSHAGGIDLARHINDSAKNASLTGKKGKAYILNEIQGANKYCMNALLEITEEPPENTIFIMATTEPQHLLSANKSRAVKLEVKALSKNDSIKLLSRICKRENLVIDDNFLFDIYRVSSGVPRDMLVLLTQISKLTSSEDIQQLIEDSDLDSIKGSPEVIKFCKGLLDGDSFAVNIKTLKLVQEKPEAIRRIVLSYMTKVLMGKGLDKRAAIILTSFYSCDTTVGIPAIVHSMINIYY